MTHQLKIAPSLLSCDFSNLETEVKNCERFGADILHVDVMDGHFVPNITIGPLIVKAIRPHSKLPIDCHLMISNPDNYIDNFADAGADYISVHAEVCNHLHRTLSKIKERNCKAGVVLNPITPLQYAYDAAEYADFILLMSVNPGFGGQSFISNFIDRCSTLRDYLDNNGLNHVEIEVDGGVKAENIKQVVNAGANMIVSGSGLFKGNFQQNILDMKSAVTSSR